MAKEIITIENLQEFKTKADETYQPKGDYATTSDIPDVSELTEQVAENTKDIEDLKSGEGVDLSDYAKTAEIEDGTIVAAEALHTTSADEATTASSTAGTLTVTIDEETSKTFDGSEDVGINLSGYATETYADTAASTAADAAEKAANTYTDGELEGYATVASLSDYSTKAETVTAVAVDGADISVTTNGTTVTKAVNNVANATSAKQLATGRTMQTDLSSTSAATFDGTADVTLGVTGTLPVGNGGTGATSLDNVTVGAASKLGSDTKGSATKPIYLSSGTATECSDMADTLTGASASIGDTGATLTFSRLGGGTATATIPLAGDTAGLMSKEDKANLDMLMWINTLEPVLNKNSWAEISYASLLGQGKNLWSVGACKKITISGTMGATTKDIEAWVYILGFDHNSALEGSNTIHFGGFKTSDGEDAIDTCLVYSYGSYATGGTLYFNMNHWGNYNRGGWQACDMRYDILGSTDVAQTDYGSTRSTPSSTSENTGQNPTATCATNPKEGTLMSCLPEDLRAVMRPMTKYTDNIGASSGNVETNISVTTDYLPLLAEFEVHGARTYANSYEQYMQEQYEYYALGNSKIKVYDTDESTAAYWWSRSPCYSTNHYFCYTGTSGTANSYAANHSRGVAPAFCV